MKVRNYEKMTFISFLIGGILLLELLMGIYLQEVKIRECIFISMIIREDNRAETILTKEERKILYKNNSLYWKNKRIKYEIEEDQKIGKEYRMILHVQKDMRENDVITGTIENKKISIIDMIINMWGGDKNR